MGRKEKLPIIPEIGDIPTGSIIRLRRRLANLSISELAALVGPVTQSYITSIERNNEKPSEEMLDKIAVVLGYESRDQLLSMDNKEAKKSLEGLRKMRIVTNDKRKETIILSGTLKVITESESFELCLDNITIKGSDRILNQFVNSLRNLTY